DLVIFWGSSVIYDALRKGKPVFFLDYLINLEFEFQDTITGWNVVSRQHLSNLLASFVRNKEDFSTYSNAERDNCIKKYVDDNDSDVLGRYERFFSDLPVGDRA